MLKMNSFLHRILGKREDESNDGKISSTQAGECSPKSYKSNWMKKLGAYSPNKRDLSPSIGISSPLRPISMRTDGLHYHDDNRRRSVPEPLTPVSKSSVRKVEMPDLEKIIHEFEEGFLSPTKQPTKETVKTGRFVKQIVAAFEEKFKTYSNQRTEAAGSSNEWDRNEKATCSIESRYEDEIEESETFMGTTYVIETALENELSQYLEFCESKSETYSRRSVESSRDFDMCTFAMDEDSTMFIPGQKLRGKKMDESIKSKSEIIVEALKKETPQRIDPAPVVRSNSSMKRERQPKIVGAYLKKPIEVEDTSIDWIPITGKKLPRKRSFKRLLSVLTGKKSSEKSSKLYCSQINLPEENIRELHDSGYDEKSSSSSSSLTSLVSFTDILSQQDYNIDTNRRILTTFRQNNATNDENRNGNSKMSQQCPPIYARPCNGCEIIEDDSEKYFSFPKKLLLEEVPRSELRLSLGPAFPKLPPNIIEKAPVVENTSFSEISFDISDCTFEDLSCESLAELPKHPFVTSREKFDAKLTAFETERNFNYFEDVQLRRDTNSWKFYNSENNYDVPRKFISKSDPGLATNFDNKQYDDFIYDIPKPEILQRPRSSVYEDALSLKRRNEHFTYATPTSSFYAFPSPQENHYATVKPRNTKIKYYPRKESITSGISDSKIYTHCFRSNTV